MSKKRIVFMMSCTTISGVLLIIGLFTVIEGKECPTMTRPHATRCDKYYECSVGREGTSSEAVQWTSKQCDEGLVYDSEMAVCVLPDFDWECRLPDDEPQAISFDDDDNNIYGIENLDLSTFGFLNSHTPVYPNNENDDNREIYNQIETKIRTIQDEFGRKLSFGRMPKINLSEREEGSGSAEQEHVTDANSLITSQLLRLNQIMKGAKREGGEESNEITPDKLNQFLAVHNIQSEATTLPTFDDKAEIPATGMIEPEDMKMILNMTQAIPTTQPPPDDILFSLALPTVVSKVPSTAETFPEFNSGKKKTDAEKFQEFIANLKAPNQQYSAQALPPHQQIIVHRPGGSVWFNVPTSTERTTTTPAPPPPLPPSDASKPPAFSEEVVRLLLELSKQLVSSQQAQKPPAPESVLQPVVRPIYINVPLQPPPKPSYPGYYEEAPKVTTPKPVLNSYGQKLPNYPPLQSEPSYSRPKPGSSYNIPFASSYEKPHEGPYGNTQDTNSYGNSQGSSQDNSYGNSHGSTYESSYGGSYEPGQNSFYGDNHENSVEDPQPQSYYPVNKPQKRPSYYTKPNRVDTNYNQPYNPYSDYSKPINYGHFYYNDHDQGQQNYPNYQPQPPFGNPFYQDYASQSANYYKPYQVPLYAQPAFHLPASNGISAAGANGLLTLNSNVGHSPDNTKLGDDMDANTNSDEEPAAAEGDDVEEEDNDNKKYVDLGGNIFSYDQYVSSILPLLQNTDKVQEAQVVTCTNGARQANRTDCTKYFLCNPKTGGIYSYSCPLNTAFDEASKFCTKRRYNECKQPSKGSSAIKLHLEALRTLEEAKRIKDQAVQAQNLASFLQYQNMRPKLKLATLTTTTPAPLTRDSLPLLAALINNYKEQNQQPQVIVQAPTTKRSVTRRRLTCLQPGKVPDPDSKDHYYVCFKTPENYLKLHKMKCPMNFNFCKSTLLCGPQEKCVEN